MFPEVKYAAPPEWAYQVNNARMQIINETNLPEGPFKNAMRSCLSHQLKVTFSSDMCVGIRIETEGEKKNHNTSGFKLNYYESRLDLFEITRDTHTTYQCKANKYKDAVTKAISFRIKGK